MPPLLATVDELLAPGGQLFIASRLARFGLAECLTRLLRPRVHGGLELQLVSVVRFGTDGEAAETRPGSDTTVRTELAEAEAAERLARSGEADNEGAPHRLWIFARADGAGAGAGTDMDAAATLVQAPYHERQRLMRCGQHAINNLLGMASVTSSELDAIARELSEGGLGLAHRWPILGNYDINVILIALQRRGYEAEWWDRRKRQDELQATLCSTAASAAIVGALLNVRSRPRLLGGLLPFGRHWLALRPVAANGPPSQQWLDVDSDLEQPAVLEDVSALLAKVEQLLSEADGHLIVVRRRKPESSIVRPLSAS